jgi:diketogulonate reductase-like aldo/keto reductase
MVAIHKEKLDFDLVGVAPAPVFARLERLHDRMGSVLEVFGRVTIRGAVAASDMATRQAQTQMHPSGADLKAILASLGAGLYFVDLIQVSTFRHTSSGKWSDVATFIGDSFPLEATGIEYADAMTRHLPSPPFLYGTAWKEERTAALTELAIRAGFRGIDTANQRRHYFEAGVGEALAVIYRAGLVRREDIFLQTKFTYQNGQDHRLPYDPAAEPALQVVQSLASSLEHLGCECVDSYALHGPYSNLGWSEVDAEVWEAMMKEKEAGRTRLLGVSNVSLRHLEQLFATHTEAPSFVQNRCYAQLGWDREVRRFCSERDIIYQGFSLLTANVPVLRHPAVARIAARLRAGVAQVIFAFAREVGMLPLTGTSDPEHMKRDLEALALDLSTEEVQAIESLVG